MSKFGVLVMGPAGAGKVSLLEQHLQSYILIDRTDYVLHSSDRASAEFPSKLLLR
jgi:GTPase SAR1 family protein